MRIADSGTSGAYAFSSDRDYTGVVYSKCVSKLNFLHVPVTSLHHALSYAVPTSFFCFYCVYGSGSLS